MIQNQLGVLVKVRSRSFFLQGGGGQALIQAPFHYGYHFWAQENLHPNNWRQKIYSRELQDLKSHVNILKQQKTTIFSFIEQNKQLPNMSGFTCFAFQINLLVIKILHQKAPQMLLLLSFMITLWSWMHLKKLFHLSITAPQNFLY